MSASAGRVLLIPKGAYNASTTYTVMDSVTYQGNSYVCKQTSTGNVPTNTTYWQILVDNSDLVGDISDLTTEVGNVKQALSDEVSARSQLGAHNLMPIDLEYLRTNNITGTWSGNVYTFTNFTATFNSDGTVTVSGTPNSLLTIDLGELTGLRDVILSGCPSGGSANTYYLQFYNKTDSQWGQSDYGSGKSVTLDSSKTYKVYLAIRGNVTISPAIIFKPMIRLATDTDPTYQPYAMTNKELTDVAKQTQGNYVYSKPYVGTILVTADGVKTEQTLLNELYTAFANFMGSLSSDEMCKLVCLNRSGGLYICGEVFRNSVAGDYSLICTDITSAVQRFFHITLKSTNSISGLYDLQTNTYTNRASVVPASGSAYQLRLEVIKKIS